MKLANWVFLIPWLRFQSQLLKAYRCKCYRRSLIKVSLTFEGVERDARNWQVVSDWTSRRGHPATILRKRNFWVRRSGATSGPSVAPNFDYLEIAFPLIPGVPAERTTFCRTLYVKIQLAATILSAYMFTYVRPNSPAYANGLVFQELMLYTYFIRHTVRPGNGLHYELLHFSDKHLGYLRNSSSTRINVYRMIDAPRVFSVLLSDIVLHEWRKVIIIAILKHGIEV